MGGWLYENVHVLKAYITHSPLCAIAQSHSHDGVMPILLSIFARKSSKPPDTLDPESIRTELLRGLDDEKLILSNLAERKRRNRPDPSANSTKEYRLEDTWELRRKYWTEYSAIEHSLANEGIISRLYGNDTVRLSFIPRAVLPACLDTLHSGALEPVLEPIVLYKFIFGRYNPHIKDGTCLGRPIARF
jgi:hypothetical protein